MTVYRNMIRIADLFCGIGGFRTGFGEKATCVFSSDIDLWARKTYAHWYGDTPSGDITKILSKDIPDHDVLTAGFP